MKPIPIIWALAENYPSADRQRGWQFVFPAGSLSLNPRSGNKRRHPLDESLRSSPLFQGGYSYGVPFTGR